MSLGSKSDPHTELTHREKGRYRSFSQARRPPAIQLYLLSDIPGCLGRLHEVVPYRGNDALIE
jgi:hypothetical protein